MKSAYSSLPKVIAHRGSSGIAPENTLASLHLAGQQGAKWVEIDVMLSGDGIPVIFHDDSLARTTNGEGLIYKTPLAGLKKLDAGSWKHNKYPQETIPTLFMCFICTGQKICRYFLAASVILPWSAPSHSGQKLLAAIMYLLSQKLGKNALSILIVLAYIFINPFLMLLRYRPLKRQAIKSWPSPLMTRRWL